MKEATQEVNMMAIVVISCDCSEREVIDGIEYCSPCYIDEKLVDGMKCLYKG